MNDKFLEKSNQLLTTDVSIIQYDVSVLQNTSPTLLTFEPSAGTTTANNLDAYIDSATSRLFLVIDASVVSFDVSIL